MIRGCRDGINGCQASAIRLCDNIRAIHPCLKVAIVAAIILMGVGLAASWVPQMPSSLISPCLKIGGMLTGVLVMHKISNLPKEPASTEGRRLKITLLVAAILVIGGAVTSHLLTGGPAGMGQAGLYIGIPLLISSVIQICLKKYASSCFDRLEEIKGFMSLEKITGLSNKPE